MLSSEFLLKGLKLALPQNYEYDFLRKTFPMKYSLNWPNVIVWLPNVIVWLPLRYEILNNTCIVIIFCPVWGVLNLKINHSFLIKLFFYITRNRGHKNKKSFQIEKKKKKKKPLKIKKKKKKKKHFKSFLKSFPWSK